MSYVIRRLAHVWPLVKYASRDEQARICDQHLPTARTRGWGFCDGELAFVNVLWELMHLEKHQPFIAGEYVF